MDNCFLGIDVAKRKLDCCLIAEGKPSKTKVVENNPKGFAELLRWCRTHAGEPDKVHAILEPTGVYHQNALRALFDAKMRVSVVNPAQARLFAQSQGFLSKNDHIDAAALARYGKVTPLRLWQPPAPEANHLTTLIARRQAILQDLQREKNRREKTNSEASGLATPYVTTSLNNHIKYLERELEAIEKEMDDVAKKDPRLAEDRALMLSIPGVGAKVSIAMLALFSGNTFDSAEQAAAFLGLVPVEHQSGSSVNKRPHLAKNGNADIRAKLYMAAIAARQRNPHIKAFCERLAMRGKKTMSILAAAMRKIVHLCYGVLHTRIPYQKDFAPATQKAVQPA